MEREATDGESPEDQQLENTLNASREIAMDIDRLISDTKLTNSLLDVSFCAERIARRHPLAACLRAQIEEILECAGVAAGVAMKLVGREPSH
jgi:hypothetical protein